MELVGSLQRAGFHVTLYRVGPPSFFAPLP